MLFLFLSFLFFPAHTEVLSLELLDYYRVDHFPEERLDLSGLIWLTPELKKNYHLENFDFVLVSDKSPWIYRARISGKNELKAEVWRKIDIQWNVRLDFEDIEAANGRLYIVNEGDGSLVELDPNGRHILHQWKNPSPRHPLDDWFGIEGLAWDGKEFWFFKEMPPLSVFIFSPNSSAPVRWLASDRQGSQTAARFHKDKLFVIDRESRCLWEMKKYFEDPRCWSFQKYVDQDPRFHFQVRDHKGQLHPEWSTAEALDIHKDRIWIGLDNNGEALYSDPKEKRPVILVFRRPR